MPPKGGAESLSLCLWFGQPFSYRAAAPTAAPAAAAAAAAAAALPLGDFLSCCCCCCCCWEYAPAKHVLGSEPGSRVTGAGAHTARRAVIHPRQEPCAGKPHARIWAGGAR